MKINKYTKICISKINTFLYIKKINAKNNKHKKKCICLNICPKLDNNDTFNGLVLPLFHSWTIWYFSFVHIFTSFYAIMNNYYFMSLLGFGSVGTSLNYWKYPKYNSLRRYFDIFFIQITLYVHMYHALMITTGNGYMFFIGIGIICYGISNYYINKNIFFATYFHILVHVFASIGNGILYSGILK